MKNHAQRILRTILAKAPIEAIEAYESANAIFASRTGEPRTVEASEPTRPTPTPAPVKVAHYAPAKPDPKVVQDLVAAMRSVRGLK